MQSTMRTSLPVLVVAALVTGVTWWVLHNRATARQMEITAAHRETFAALQQEWARHRAQREVAAHQAARERARRQEQELETAMGGPAAAAAKKPGISIAESIQGVARACAPRATQVRVRVDRFTEFSALLELPSRLEAPALAELARCILGHSSAYLHRLQFSYRGSLLGELDRRAIESVADWRSVTLAEVQRAMATTEGRAEAVASVGSPPLEPPPAEREAEQNLTPEARRQLQVSEAFHASMKTAHQRLSSALESHRQATDLAGVGTLQDLEAKKTLLQQADALASQAEAVLVDPAAEYRRLLEEARLDEVYVRSAVRTVALRYDALRSATAEMFGKLAADLQSSNSLLEALEKHWGDWTYNAQQRKFSFLTSAQGDIKGALEQGEVTTRALELSLAQWAQLVKAVNKAGEESGR
jgi:hypothetical protein